MTPLMYCIGIKYLQSFKIPLKKELYWYIKSSALQVTVEVPFCYSFFLIIIGNDIYGAFSFSFILDCLQSQ